MSWTLLFSREAVKDKARLRQAGLADNAKALLAVLRENPFANPPRYEKLVGDLMGLYSRRINRQHRLVYAIDVEAKRVRILRMWTHYE